MSINELKNHIEDLLITWDPLVFVVDISLKQGKKSVLSVKIDRDGGITLSTCTKASRKISQWLEDNNPLDFSYTLEVSSPGVGYPLQLKRQYLNNIGRIIQLNLREGEDIKGELVRVEDEKIILNTAFKETKGKKKGKKSAKKEKLLQDEAQKEIHYAEIKNAKVIII